jgi:alkylation response protein AidB-like acyl-CoA dehydrogenase
MNVDLLTLSMLAESVAEFAKANEKRARLTPDAGFSVDRAAWTQIAAQGWLSVLVPEDWDGVALGMAGACTIARELGRHAMPDPFVSVAVLGLSCLLRANDPVRWKPLVADICAGKFVVSCAWQGLTGGLDPSEPGVEVRLDGSDYLLTGAARFYPVPSADALLVSARHAGKLGLYYVTADGPGVVSESEHCIDGRVLGSLRLDNVRLPSDCQVVGEDRALQVLDQAIEATLLATSAELVGVMDTVLELTLEYLRNRRQFGVPIGSFQVLQHKAVDMWIQNRLSEATVNAATKTLDDPTSSTSARRAAACGAKARTSQAALQICSQALQLHGAIGFTDEYRLGGYLRRALMLSAWMGNAAHHRTQFGRLQQSRGDQ